MTRRASVHTHPSPIKTFPTASREPAIAKSRLPAAIARQRIPPVPNHITMQISPSLADFMEKLEEGPRGPDDALVIIQQCAQQSAPLLDLQQMQLTDEDLQLLAPKMASLSSHVTTLNLFMNQYVLTFKTTPSSFSSYS